MEHAKKFKIVEGYLTKPVNINVFEALFNKNVKKA